MSEPQYYPSDGPLKQVYRNAHRGLFVAAMRHTMPDDGVRATVYGIMITFENGFSIIWDVRESPYSEFDFRTAERTILLQDPWTSPVHRIEQVERVVEIRPLTGWTVREEERA